MLRLRLEVSGVCISSSGNYSSNRHRLHRSAAGRIMRTERRPGIISIRVSARPGYRATTCLYRPPHVNIGCARTSLTTAARPCVGEASSSQLPASGSETPWWWRLAPLGDAVGITRVVRKVSSLSKMKHTFNLNKWCDIQQILFRAPLQGDATWMIPES